MGVKLGPSQAADPRLASNHGFPVSDIEGSKAYFIAGFGTSHS